MSEERTHTCPHCEREFKSEAVPGKDGKPAGHRLALILPGVEKIEDRVANCLLARVLLVLTWLCLLLAVLCVVFALFTAVALSRLPGDLPEGAMQGDYTGVILSVRDQAVENLGAAVWMIGFSLISAVFCYGFAQHVSHVAKTALYTERICQFLEKQDGR